MIRQSDIDAVAKAIDPEPFRDGVRRDLELPEYKPRRRTARANARHAIEALLNRGWLDPALRGW